MSDSDTTGPLEGPTTVTRDVEIDGQQLTLEVRDPPQPELEEWGDRLAAARNGDTEESEMDVQLAYIDEFVRNHEFTWPNISVRRKNILFKRVQNIHRGTDEFMSALREVQTGNGVI